MMCYYLNVQVQGQRVKDAFKSECRQSSYELSVLITQYPVRGHCLTDNSSHHCSSQTCAWCPAMQRPPIVRSAVGLGPRDLVQRIAVNTSLPYLSTALEIWRLGLQTGVTSATQIVRCTPSFGHLRQPAGSDWRQLSCKIMAVCRPNTVP